MSKKEKARELYLNGNHRLTDIAVELGVPVGTVRSWKSRGAWDNSATLQNKKRNVAKAQKVETNEEEHVQEQESDLNERQQLFCIYYIKTFNATRAYMKAYGSKYNVAAASAHNLLKNPKIKREIQRLKQNKLNREMLSMDDIFQKYIDIAFADITDFIEFGQEEIPVIGMYGPVKIKKEDGTEQILMQKTNVLRFKEHTEVDGTIIAEVRQSRNGDIIRLGDRMKALEWLANHMDLASEEQKLKIESLKKGLEEQDARIRESEIRQQVAKAKGSLYEQEEIADDGFLEALAGTAQDDWSDYSEED